MKIIGLGHYSRTGKDSFGNYLLDSLCEYNPRFRASKKSFAWQLKKICHELYGWDGMREPEFYETPEGAKYRDIVLPNVGKTPVQTWIDFGTPAVREQVYDRSWIDYLLKTDHNLDVLVIPDVRFENEVQAILDLGGTLIKVVRPGYGPRKSVADRALVGFDGWDYIIGGSGQMSELEAWAWKFARWITGGPEVTQSLADRDNAKKAEVIEPWEPSTLTAEPVLDLQVNAALAKQLVEMHANCYSEGFAGLDDELVEMISTRFPGIVPDYLRKAA